VTRVDAMTTAKIVSLDAVPPEIEAVIREVAQPDFEVRFVRSSDADERLELAGDADFLLLGPGAVNQTLLDRCARVRLIQKYGIGVDKIDIDAARRAGIGIAIAAGANAGPVSDLALGLMIAVNRQLIVADRGLRSGQWAKSQLRASSLQLDGKVVGFLGFGAIGRMTARRLAGFEVEILYNDQRRADEVTERALRAKFVSFDAVLERSDILSLHLPLTDATRHLINADALSRMKRDAILINVARGGVVDEAALFDALSSRRLRAAGIDVFAVEPPGQSHPLFSLDNVIVTPHIGGAVFDNVHKVMQHSIDNMRRVLAGKPLSDADVVVSPVLRSA
jgi:D-3-phosphoglycerate dehydrogenase / 2-oxoglutarate reductase